MADQRNTAESALHSVITASAGDKLVKNLVAEAARRHHPSHVGPAATCPSYQQQRANDAVRDPPRRRAASASSAIMPIIGR